MRVVRLWGPPVLLAATIYVLSSLSQVPGGEYVYDKLGHLAVFGVLGYLTLRATHGGSGPLSPLPAATAVLLVVAWGALDEFHQSFVPGRYPSVADVVADALGAGLAVLVWAWRGRGDRVARISGAGAASGGQG